MYKKMEQKSLKKLHEAETQILDEIDRVCKKNNIQYFLAYGTLLGAVRHKGFIPWDDDIDIGMTRTDYEKFKKACERDLDHDNFYIQDNEDKNSWLGFLKVRMKNTIFREQAIKDIDKFQGIFVDIFPFDNVEKFNILFKIKAFIIRTLNVNIWYKFKIYGKNYFRRPFFNYLMMPLSIKTSKKIMKRLMSSNGNDDSKYICAIIGDKSAYDESIKRDLVFPLKELEFEGKKYPVPNNYHEVLTRYYGDYMKLPKKEDRVNHSVVEIKFKD